jgi:DNA-directed RNA polymerase subunit RPC12/RpoP
LASPKRCWDRAELRYRLRMRPAADDDDVTSTVRCTHCGWHVPVPSAWRHSPEKQKLACPQCGATGWLVELAGHAYEFASLRGRRPGEKRPYFELQQGEQLAVTSQRWMKKRRLIDRDGDRYEETVVDLVTGETIHECSEPLSEHWGHGSAKGQGSV